MATGSADRPSQGEHQTSGAKAQYLRDVSGTPFHQSTGLIEVLVTPASCRLSRELLALGTRGRDRGPRRARCWRVGVRDARWTAAAAATLLFCCIILAARGWGATVPEIAAKVDHRYNDMQTLRAEFTETYRGAGVSRSESGTLWLKRPGRMLWDYREPRQKMFITDGKTAWFYIPGERQARKAPVKKLDDLRTPLRYLLGKTKLEKEFAGLSLASDVQPLKPGDTVLRGVPKGMEDRVSSVLLEVSPAGMLNDIVVNGVDGSTTEYRFDHQQENQPIADQRFRFSPPAGVETIEAEDVAP
jgi:outer membrane lipoprotein carrier protein